MGGDTAAQRVSSQKGATRGRSWASGSPFLLGTACGYGRVEISWKPPRLRPFAWDFSASQFCSVGADLFSVGGNGIVEGTVGVPRLCSGSLPPQDKKSRHCHGDLYREARYRQIRRCWVLFFAIVRAVHVAGRCASVYNLSFSWSGCSCHRKEGDHH